MAGTAAIMRMVGQGVAYQI